MEGGFDLAAPHYARRKFEGLLNSSIISPLIRCLYGKRIQNPLGPDLGFSRALFEVLGGNDRTALRVHPLASLTPIAICDQLRVCQVHVGHRILPPTDWTNISSLLVQALGPVFLTMERNAACWQKTRASIPVSGFGGPLAALQESETIDVNRLVNSFQLGIRDLQEISAFVAYEFPVELDPWSWSSPFLHARGSDFPSLASDILTVAIADLPSQGLTGDGSASQCLTIYSLVTITNKEI